MSVTTVNLGYVPKNRGEYSSTAYYYKDNIVQYNGSSYIADPPTYDPDTDPTAYIVGVAPYASDPAVPNTGWAVFANDSNGVGEGVYNVSVDHTTDGQPKKYADLSAALADVPPAKQKGGMSIKFVQSSDNRYVQFRYMESDASTAATFTNVANWQGVDDEPIPGSNNLVESGGVNKKIYGTPIYNNNYTFNGLSNIYVPYDVSGGLSAKIQIDANNVTGDSFIVVIEYERTYNFVDILEIKSEDNNFHDIEIPSGTLRLIISHRNSSVISAEVNIYSGKGAVVALTANNFKKQQDEIDKLTGIPRNYSYTYNSSGNWNVPVKLESNKKYGVKLNCTAELEVALHTTSAYPVVATVNDSLYHEILTPSAMYDGNNLIIVYRGTSPVNVSLTLVEDSDFLDNELTQTELINAVTELTNSIGHTTGRVGEGIGVTVFNSNMLFVPNKIVTKNGKLKTVFFMANEATSLTIYIGEVDQLRLFIPRTSFVLSVESGNNTIDVTSRDINVYAGEYIGFLPTSGGVKFYNGTEGDPESENSFLYSVSTADLFHLQVYGAQKIFKVGAYADYETNNIVVNEVNIDKNVNDINAIRNEVAYIGNSINTVKDTITGKKYKIEVVNGVLQAVSMAYSHVLAVGNSYTVHPTVDDVSPLHTNLWWGHWSMAASSPDVCWTKLVENALKAEDSSAVVTPIFGRTYETGGAAITDNNAFCYWESGTLKYLKPNISDFSDVDCVLLFLGDNYTGDNWGSLYTPLINQFKTWFPTAAIYCIGAVIREGINNTIREIAGNMGIPYINVYGIKTLALRSREGNYVLGDDNNLHQIDYSAVGDHFGDYGEYELNRIISAAIGYNNVTDYYTVTLNSGTLSLQQYNYLEGSIVSIFADDSVSSIVVKDSSQQTITATEQTGSSYGKIFTFVMPDNNVTVTAS